MFEKNKHNKLKLYKKFLHSNFKNLKKIRVRSTRSEIKISINEKTSYLAFDWQEEIISLNNIYAMILGIIDGRNDEYERNLIFENNFNNIKEIERIKFKQLELSKVRTKITQDYGSISEINHLEVIKETINCTPSYINFDNLFKDMKENSYNLVIQGHLISAYMFGYNNSLYILPQDIIPYYNQIISEYKLSEAKLENKKNKYFCKKRK